MISAEIDDVSLVFDELHKRQTFADMILIVKYVLSHLKSLKIVTFLKKK